MRLYHNSKATISIAYDLVQHDGMKHVEIGRHFIKKKLQIKQICIPFVKTKDLITDVFTKGLCSPFFVDE